MSYLTMVTNNNVNPISASLYNLKYSSGYNNMLHDLGIESYFKPRTSSSRRLLQTASNADLNPRLKALGYSSAYFAMNFNYMFLAIVVILAVFGMVWLLGRCNHHKGIMKVASFFLRDILFTVLFFCVNSMAFSMGVQCRYLLVGQQWDTPLIISWIVALLSFVLLIGYLAFYCRSYTDFDDFHKKFK